MGRTCSESPAFARSASRRDVSEMAGVRSSSGMVDAKSIFCWRSAAHAYSRSCTGASRPESSAAMRGNQRQSATIRSK